MTAPSTLRKGFLFKLHACYRTWKECKDAIFNGLHCANNFYYVISSKDFYGPEFWCAWVVHWQMHIHARGYFEFSQLSCLIKSTENIHNYFTLDPVTFCAKCLSQNRTQSSDWSISILLKHLNGASYPVFLQEVLPKLLNPVPEHITRRM